MNIELLAKKLLLAFLVILLPNYIFASFLKSNQQIDEIIIANISRQYLQTKTNFQFQQLLAKEFKNSSSINNTSIEVITNVFSANRNANFVDELNPISNALFKKALFIAKKNNRKDLQLWATVQYGYYLYNYRKYELSFPLFMMAINSLDQIEEQDVLEAIETYKKTAYFLMTVGDYEKANDYLLIARKYAKRNSSELAVIIDNLGLNSKNQNNLVKAEQYFKEALEIAKASNNNLRYGKLLGNIAEIKFKQQKLDTAIILLYQDIAISKKFENKQNTIYAMVLLGKVYLAKGNLKEANEQLQIAKSYAQGKSYLKSAAYEINSLILEIAKKTGDSKTELTSRRILEELKEALIHLDGKEAITKLGWQMEKKKLELSVQKEKAEREKETLIKFLTLFICLFLIILIAYLIRHFQQQIKNEKTAYDKKILSIMLDKVNSEQKLNANHQTLESYKAYLVEKNDQIENLEFEILKIKKSSAVHLANYSAKMQDLLNSHLMDHNSWQDFKRLFTATYPEYQKYLFSNFPELTDSHLRIIFLTKLDLSNIETARVLGLTIEAIKKAKQRLRKKYGEKYESIINYNDQKQ